MGGLGGERGGGRVNIAAVEVSIDKTVAEEEGGG